MNTDEIRDHLRTRIEAHVAPTFRASYEQEPHAEETALVTRLTDAVLPMELELRAEREANARMRQEMTVLQAERAPLGDEIEARYILDPADDEWDRAYNTAVRDVLRFLRGDLRPGLELARDAVRTARGGDAPPQIRGFA